MRTTITFDADTAVAVEQLRRRRGVGVSAATNELIRRGALHPDPTPRFVQETSAGHAKVDVADVAAVLELLDEDEHRRPARA